MMEEKKRIGNVRIEKKKRNRWCEKREKWCK